MRLDYTIEEVLEHTPLWITEIYKELSIQEMEEKLFQMSLHGVSKQEVQKIRENFLMQFEKSEKENDVSLSNFQKVGLKFGKPTGTTVIRAEHLKEKNNG